MCLDELDVLLEYLGGVWVRALVETLLLRWLREEGLLGSKARESGLHIGRDKFVRVWLQRWKQTGANNLLSYLAHKISSFGCSPKIVQIVMARC